MRCGSIYLVVKNFEASVSFYEKILDRKVRAKNGERFAMFQMEGLNLCIMNGYFDGNHADEVKRKGDVFPVYDDMAVIADSENTRKVFLNLGVDDLRLEYDRIRALNIARDMTPIRYIEYTSPYWYFTFQDPDGNAIEITGRYEV